MRGGGKDDHFLLQLGNKTNRKQGAESSMRSQRGREKPAEWCRTSGRPAEPGEPRRARKTQESHSSRNNFRNFTVEKSQRAPSLTCTLVIWTQSCHSPEKAWIILLLSKKESKGKISFYNNIKQNSADLRSLELEG